MMPVLTGVDILGIQLYVFGSNRLRDVLAASWMVDHVTHCDQLKQWPSPRPSSVLLAAGGNAILEFVSMDAARCWTALYTRWLYESAPGPEAVIVHRPFGERPLAWALRVLQVDLARAKLERLPSAPQLGLSATASCTITGLPATDDDQGALISPRVKRLREKVQEARDRWSEYLWSEYLPILGSCATYEPDFPDEIDLMGRTHGEASLVGVVHVDGNDVGERIKDWLDRCIEKDVDQNTVRRQYEEWSNAIIELGRAVTTAVTGRAAACIQWEESHPVLRGTPFDLGFRLYERRDDKSRKTATSSVFLPLRPVLLGGDDLTFLCDGRIALDLAVTALKEFACHPVPHLGPNGEETVLTACAGVALVKAHAPFHRSYELAEDLCRSAKRARRTDKERLGVETGGWLDWHIGSTRPGERVEDIRRRQYQRGGRDLTMRPYPLAKIEGRNQSWEWLDGALLGPGVAPDIVKQGLRGAEGWSGSRSRVKRLRALVSDGAAEVKRQIEAWKAADKAADDVIRLPGGLEDDGHIGHKTPLLDAIELLDLHMRLEPDRARPLWRRTRRARTIPAKGGQRDEQ
jgi:hypothetical protein